MAQFSFYLLLALLLLNHDFIQFTVHQAFKKNYEMSSIVFTYGILRLRTDTICTSVTFRKCFYFLMKSNKMICVAQVAIKVYVENTGQEIEYLSFMG